MRVRSFRKGLRAALSLLVFFALALPSGAEGIEFGFDAEAAFGLDIWNDGFFSALGAGTPSGKYPVSASAEPSLFVEFLPGLSLLARVGIEGEGFVNDVGSSRIRASIPEVVLSLGIGDGVFIRGGILPLPPGADPLFKPAYWPSRFTPDIYAKGGTSFLGVQASAYLGDFKLGLLFLPEIDLPLFDLFRKPVSLVTEGGATGSAAEARVSCSLFGGSAALFGFCQSEAGSLVPRFGGLGFDAAFPMGDRADLRGEGLYSTGLPRYESAAGELSLAKGSTDEWGLAFAISAGATAFSILEFRAGYSYSDRVSPKQDLSLSLVLPRITDSLGLSLIALIRPEDLSSRWYFELFLETAEATRFRLRGEFSPSPEESVRGSASTRASISILADISHREEL